MAVAAISCSRSPLKQEVARSRAHREVMAPVASDPLMRTVDTKRGSPMVEPIQVKRPLGMALVALRHFRDLTAPPAFVMNVVMAGDAEVRKRPIARRLSRSSRKRSGLRAVTPLAERLRMALSQHET